MNLTWHVFAKDFARMKAAVIGWLGLMALKILFYAFVSGVIGAPNVPWLIRLGQGPELAIRICVEPLIAFVLVGWMVFEDPIAGTDGFWVTRPISGTRLLAAKALGATLLFVLLPIVINVPWWLSCGFGAAQVARAAIPVAAEYSAIVVVGIGVASATTSFQRYFLWTIAGIAGLGVVHLMASVFMRSGLGFQSTQEMGTGLALTRALILLACILLVSVEIAAHQFLSRHFRRSLPIIVAVTIALSVTAFSSHLNFFPKLGWDARADAQAALGHGPPAAPDSDVGVSVPSGPARQPSYDEKFMAVPMTITGLAPGMAAFWQTQAEWYDGGKSIWRAVSYEGHYYNELIRKKMGNLVGITTDVQDFDCDDLYQFPWPLARRYADKTISFHAKVYLYLLKGAIVAEAPIADGSFRQTGASFSVNDLSRGEHGVRMTVTDRFERTSLLAFLGVVWPRETTWTLVNRAKGEIRIGKQELGSNSLGLQLNMVSVVSERIAIDDIASSERLEGARLVAFNFDGDHNIERRLDEEPFHFTYLTPEDPKYPSKKMR
jgi:hypothetical protein